MGWEEGWREAEEQEGCLMELWDLRVCSKYGCSSALKSAAVRCLLTEGYAHLSMPCISLFCGYFPLLSGLTSYSQPAFSKPGIPPLHLPHQL